MTPYSSDIEQHMKELYERLTEDQKRKYATIEAKKLGHGGVKYVSQLLGCSPRTIYRGRKELEIQGVKKNFRDREN